MTDPDPDRLAQLRELAERVGGTAHDDLARETTERFADFVVEVDADFEQEEHAAGARKLLAFWESFVQRKLEGATEEGDPIAEDPIDRFEQAFDEDVIGIDLYQALETLAIVEDIQAAERDHERLSQWAARVQALTEEFATHLKSHAE